MQALRRARALLFGSAGILTAIGIVMIYSASAIYAYDKLGDSTYYLKRHALYVILGAVLGVAAFSADLWKLRRHSKRMLTVMLVLMVLVLVPHVGTATGGARRWFKLMGFSFQPSEFLKITLVLYLADFLDRKREILTDLRHCVLPSLVVLGLCSGLVFLQPDLGTAVTLALVALLMFFAAGFRVTHLLTMVLAALPVLAYASLAKPYRRKRILAFFHPWDDPRGVGFQIIQSFWRWAPGVFSAWGSDAPSRNFFTFRSHTPTLFFRSSGKSWVF